jgi:hypothetical protein
MSRKIPVPVIAIVSEVLGWTYSHSRIHSFVESANIEYIPAGGNKVCEVLVGSKRIVSRRSRVEGTPWQAFFVDQRATTRMTVVTELAAV